ncbi:hypothetical protein LCGC14_0298030 [marine sediment metagenome]|uniref:Uncharacterized protein n=1 Tax=marine sediment metagenome TaxID=412755 RepID=A0A0F9TW57_9ZZZZ
MARCIRCGVYMGRMGRRICGECMQEWKQRRTDTFAQAVEELGPLTAKTHKVILKRVKHLERAAKKEKSNE